MRNANTRKRVCRHRSWMCETKEGMSRRGICDLDIGVSSGPVEKIAAESWRCAEWTGSPSDREGQAMIGSSPTNASLPIFENFGSWVYELCVKSQNMDFTPHLFMGGDSGRNPRRETDHRFSIAIRPLRGASDRKAPTSGGGYLLQRSRLVSVGICSLCNDLRALVRKTVHV
jgi:hypothetical protein